VRHIKNKLSTLYCIAAVWSIHSINKQLQKNPSATTKHQVLLIVWIIGTSESAVCIRIEARIKSGVKIQIQIESFQLQQILIIKIINYK